ncbi:MAG: YHYH protein [Porticoccaceae bacterium]|nr:YHYH protein [Porticoccaceae bacterium]
MHCANTFDRITRADNGYRNLHDVTANTTQSLQALFTFVKYFPLGVTKQLGTKIVIYSRYLKIALTSLSTIALLAACGGGGGSSSSGGVTSGDTDTGDTDTPVTSSETCAEPKTELSGAFLEFVAAPNVDTVLSADGCTVAFESDGKPDHTSPYWDPDGSSGLWVAPLFPAVFGDPDPENASGSSSPGYIDEYVNDYDLSVPVVAEKASSTSSTSLGAIGIALSGSPLFNDQEGTGDVSIGVAQGLDYSGAHTGPQTYHYHLEPRAISYDDDALIGIIADGFFIYGRKCYSTADYPTDLDESNGHTSITQHTGADPEDAEYHYHVDQDQYLGGDYYLVFPGDYQGTPNAIN